MKKICGSLAIGTMLGILSGCVAENGAENVSPTTPNPSSNSNVQKLKHLIEVGCDWQPIASTLVGLAANAAASNSFDKISKAVCDKVNSSKATASTNGEMTVKVDKFTVRGRFIAP
ncbi:hypothetical protein [Mesorhizobium sp.]|uniref:hypothetical protein n=1 Tax=Mesorhizobium sp. TaxID=1871066 RepID=UPI000FE52911|nr:hypothetical protein [Mesorhizobium sp.]RWA81310.1 MAG: hypothetical protein EOQ30_19225 [Mesorhizobium sp.]